MLPFDLGFSELLLIAVVALFVVGPEGFPDFVRFVVKTIRTLRVMANELRESVDFMNLKREILAPLDEVRRDIDELKGHNPLSDVQRAVSYTHLTLPTKRIV